jgi:hypothetical protein
VMSVSCPASCKGRIHELPTIPEPVIVESSCGNRLGVALSCTATAKRLC